MKIKVLGTNTSGFQVIVSTLKAYLDKAQMNFELIKVSDVSVFLAEGLDSVPAIQVDGETLSLHLNGSFNKSLRKVLTNILKRKNFGKMEKIIIPVDFSDVSANAFMYGHRLSSDIGAVTKAVHVYFPTSKDLSEATLVDVDFPKLRESYFDDFIEKFDTDWGSDLLKASLIDKEFRIGFPGEEILDSAEENSAELIIMGTTGNSSRIKKWFGSVSTKVMSESDRPVLLVPEEASYKGVKNIAFAHNDISLDKSIIDKVIHFAKKFDANIHLVHVDDADNKDPGFYLEELLKQKYPPDKIITSSFFHDSLVFGLEEYAIEHEIDIIALGTKNRSFLTEIFHESVTKKMALHSRVPLLILK